MIDFVGHYGTAAFKLGADSSGDVTIVDPPAGGVHAAKAALLGNYLAASFGGGAGQIDAAPSAPPSPGDQPITLPLHT